MFRTRRSKLRAEGNLFPVEVRPGVAPSQRNPARQFGQEHFLPGREVRQEAVTDVCAAPPCWGAPPGQQEKHSACLAD
ncbi:hypothetical protein E2C01_065750 [Portunus trituberculatus]|uniref:Uncharacterized protein n=1 Tax=Portunus trituberculatus TaxID=210409 RepID=A0A5B7HJP8_PORTR|nr:hypothetical protein [Portunus trituberculatus]